MREDQFKLHFDILSRNVNYVAAGQPKPLSPLPQSASNSKPCLGPAVTEETPLHRRVADELVIFSSGALLTFESKSVLAPAAGLLMALNAAKKHKKSEILEALDTYQANL